jgi:hypothetical protein
LIRLWHILATVFFFGVTFFLLAKPLGANYAVIATVALVFAIVGVLRNAASDGGSDLDTLLLKIPVVGTIYENWFRVDTYYREDTRNLYLQLLPQFIQGVADETCAAKGVKLISSLQPLPPVSDLNKPLPPEKKPSAA